MVIADTLGMLCMHLPGQPITALRHQPSFRQAQTPCRPRFTCTSSGQATS